MKKRTSCIRSKEPTLFPEDEGGSIEDRVEHNHVPVKRSTFLAGLAARVHRWFRLTPSFGPDLVQKMLWDMATEEQHYVLDPFAGAGTTLIEAKLQGIRSIGFEINPLLAFVCRTSTQWDISPDAIQTCYKAIKKQFHRRQQASRDQDLADLGLPVPPIHNVHRWWRTDVLKDLLILKQTVRDQATDSKHRSFFDLALAGSLVPDLTNITLGRLQLHFIDKTGYDLDVWRTYSAHVETMIGDLSTIPEEVRGVPSTIHQLDSTATLPTGIAPLGPRDYVSAVPEPLQLCVEYKTAHVPPRHDDRGSGGFRS